jgi:hypothetical protein
VWQTSIPEGPGPKSKSTIATSAFDLEITLIAAEALSNESDT